MDAGATGGYENNASHREFNGDAKHSTRTPISSRSTSKHSEWIAACAPRSDPRRAVRVRPCIESFHSARGDREQRGGSWWEAGGAGGAAKAGKATR
jgi:hypothetical protein